MKNISLFACILLVIVCYVEAKKSGGGGGGIDIASLLGGLGGLKGGSGGLQFKFHGNYCGMNHGDATYLHYDINT